MKAFTGKSRATQGTKCDVRAEEEAPQPCSLVTALSSIQTNQIKCGTCLHFAVFPSTASTPQGQPGNLTPGCFQFCCTVAVTTDGCSEAVGPSHAVELVCSGEHRFRAV